MHSQVVASLKLRPIRVHLDECLAAPARHKRRRSCWEWISQVLDLNVGLAGVGIALGE